jgi:response regulator RpfG family c-di-GMP phosphodiesterase
MTLLDEQTPDLIISDMHIGQELGQDFYTLVKDRPALAAVPFMFLTSTVPRELRDLARGSHGADRFITRPIDNVLLLAEIESCLARQPGR